jgi:hypothetical protein
MLNRTKIDDINTFQFGNVPEENTILHVIYIYYFNMCFKTSYPQ